MINPFSIAFGREPIDAVARDAELEPIYESFDGWGIPTDAYLITGPRGCGKTVALSMLLDNFRKREGWLAIRLNISSGMLEQLASKIYEAGQLRHLFLRAEFSFSFHGISFSLKGDKPATSVDVLLTRMLSYLKTKNTKVLIGIDDVSPSPDLAEFIRAFQGFAMDAYDVKLVLTGLFDQVDKLQRSDSITFLARARRIFLSPLPLSVVANSYCSILDVPLEKGASFAKVTKGYAFAYQALGSILFRDGKKELDESVLRELDSMLFSMSYEIIWSELTDSERRILKSIASGNASNSAIISDLGISNGYLSSYKKQLQRKGLLDVSKRGLSSFALPRFKEFVSLQAFFD